MRPARDEPPPRRPGHEGLRPGEHCRITEEEWARQLERVQPLHQWGSAYLVDEGPPGPVRAYVRDTSGEGRHTAFCFDAATSARARDGVRRVEEAQRRVADLVAAEQARGGSSTGELAAQQEASDAFVQEAETLYRELLTIRRRRREGSGG